MPRPERAEIFGLSMLDTVTCGLGAAIVIMLFVASKVEPYARIVFTPEASQPVAGDPPPAQPAADMQPAVGMASVFLSAGEAPGAPAMEACSGERVDDDAVWLSAVHRPDPFEPRGEAARSTYGFVVQWTEDALGLDCVGVVVPMAALDDCRLTYVTDRYVAGPMACAGALSAPGAGGDGHLLVLHRSERGQYLMEGVR